MNIFVNKRGNSLAAVLSRRMVCGGLSFSVICTLCIRYIRAGLEVSAARNTVRDRYGLQVVVYINDCLGFVVLLLRFPVCENVCVYSLSGRQS